MAKVAGVTADPTVRDTFEWTGEIAEDVEQIEIFPVVPLADSTFTFTKLGWSESRTTTDPFGGTWSGGGLDLDVTQAGSDLAPGEVADATLETTAPADQYNVFFQLADGDWMVQSFGADNNAFGLQSDFVVPVPEPGTLPLLATGFVSLLGLTTRRRWPTRARKQSGLAS
jgi:PEP-CTERM motif